MRMQDAVFQKLNVTGIGTDNCALTTKCTFCFLALCLKKKFAMLHPFLPGI